MTVSFNKGLAFLIGFGVALLPSYGPFAALIFFFSHRLAFKRSDLIWSVAALLTALATGYHGGISGFSFGLLQVVAPWLIYKTFTQLPELKALPSSSSFLGFGLIAGLFMVVVLGWLQIDEINFAYKTLAQAIVWGGSPGLYGHTLLTLGALIAIFQPFAWFRVLGLGLSALGILASGSREAALAWMFVVIALLIIDQNRSNRSRAAETLMLVVMLVLTSGLGSFVGWGRMGFLLDVVPQSGITQNLIQGSELPQGDWWDTTWVDVSTATTQLDGQSLTSYRIQKSGAEPWLRLQQVIPLVKDQPYTLSTWLKPDPDTQPGMQGWGQLLGSKETFVITSALIDGEWQATAIGPGRVIRSGMSDAEGLWRRVYITFIYEGEQSPLYWYVGLAPDRRLAEGTAATFAGFQLETGQELTPYVPGPATKGLGLSVARIPYWQAAWQGIQEKPLFGWGSEQFPDYYRSNWSDNTKLQEVPSHTHNLYLQILFERGVIGLLGILILIIALTHRAYQQKDWGLLVIFTAILFANIFDYTLLYGGVLYPLAAVSGWRAVTHRKHHSEQELTAKQFSVRLTLVATDFLMAYLSLTLALKLQTLLGHPANSSVGLTLLYALLLWPAMSWREGLFPGYGLTAPQELRKHVSAVLYAGLIFAAGTVLFYDRLAVSRFTLLFMVLLSMLLLPVGRATAKRVLNALNLWGRSVVILGAGSMGQRVARSLLSAPLIGLHPVAFFDDDAAKHNKIIEGLRVEGGVSDADAYATEQDIHHVVVAMPSMPPEALSTLIRHKGKVFKRIQFMPELIGLPAEDVFASNLAGYISLEVRHGLYLDRNRWFKRSLDLLGSVVGTVLISPILLLIYVWVKLDSDGPAFYWSERVGQYGKSFYCLKFRTMFTDADERLEVMMRENEAVRQEYELYHKLDNDPRITRAGKVLRKYSLDELAQLFNVIRGEMSLVGPRPYLVKELKDMGKYSEIIFEAKPGMTGYWQVSGRNEVSFGERLQMESHYVRNWSLWWDIVILVNTFTVVLSKQGAK